MTIPRATVLLILADSRTLARAALYWNRCLTVNDSFAVLEAFPAQYRPPLRRPERNRSFFPALRAVSPCLRLGVRASLYPTMQRGCAEHRHSFSLAVLASLRFVLELLVVEKQLFTRREHKVRATIDTF